METLKIKAKVNNEIELSVMPGHFSSDRFHVNYYIDPTSGKQQLVQTIWEKLIGG